MERELEKARIENMIADSCISDEFYDAVYDELRDDPDNNRANRIIADFDEAVESIIGLILDMGGDAE